MIYKNKKFLIAGVSSSGCAAAKLLLKRGGIVYLYDQNPRIDLKELTAMGAHIVPPHFDDGIFKDIYLVIKSPGVPQENTLLERVKSRRLPVISEIELGWYNYRGCALAVTGTNGKSTVISLVDAILKQNGEQSYLCGNIGTPFTKYCLKEEDSYCCIEISSFQLEDCYEFNPHISAVLNIAEDHINRHKSMAAYIRAKKRIMKNQRQTEYAVLNFDCQNTRQFFEKAAANVYWFSAKQSVKGAYIHNGYIMFCGQKVLDTKQMQLKGSHNILNALAAVCFGMLLNIDCKVIERAVCSFKGLEHRFCFVAKIGGVNFYNDSKSTNAHSAICAASSMTENTVLLLGGYDKGEDFTPFFEQLKKYGNISCIFFGDIRQRLNDVAKCAGYNKYVICKNMADSVYKAYEICNGGGAILLSPACASYDEFENFENRGQKFIEIVNQIGSYGAN